jgi:large subunit ribosomal protein L3
MSHPPEGVCHAQAKGWVDGGRVGVYGLSYGGYLTLMCLLKAADVFKVGERVRVTGMTKGKGFQGVVKRWGFHGCGDSHGSMSHRRPGSIGQCAYPGRIWKNKRMPGHTGMDRMTVRNLEVVGVDPENNLIAVKGAIPGHPRSLVMVRGQ